MPDRYVVAEVVLAEGAVSNLLSAYDSSRHLRFVIPTDNGYALFILELDEDASRTWSRPR